MEQNSSTEHRRPHKPQHRIFPISPIELLESSGGAWTKRKLMNVENNRWRFHWTWQSWNNECSTSGKSQGKVKISIGEDNDKDTELLEIASFLKIRDSRILQRIQENLE